MTLSKKMKKLIDSHKIISFDIFDTLLSRTFVHPYDVFGFIEYTYNAEGFKNARIIAESIAHDKYGKEVNIHDIYSVLNPEFKKFEKIELDIEQRILYKNPIG